LEGSALAVGSTGVHQGAGVLADSVDAGIILRAVVVVSTTSHTLSILTDVTQQAVSVSQALGGGLRADCVGVPSELGRAGADSSVVDGGALRVPSADAEEPTGVLAESVDAGFLQGAVRVASAADDTTTVFADQSPPTLMVSAALDHVSQGLAVHPGIPDESWFTSADWSVCVGDTVGVGPTGIAE